MKDIITKKSIFNRFTLLYCLLFSPSCDSKFYKNLEEVISANSPYEKHESPPPTSKKFENISIAKDKEGNHQITWKVLQEYDMRSKSIGVNLKKVMNKSISIKGFMIPLDFSEKNIKDFLLVPYMPSCSHVPPPPPNMIINVNVKKKSGIRPSYDPVEVIGKIKISKSTKKNSNNFMPNGVYSLKATSIREVKRQ